VAIKWQGFIALREFNLKDRDFTKQTMDKIKETRPWGNYTILDEKKYYKVKHLFVEKGNKLSYQYHNKREEHWFIISGKALITINDEKNVLYPGESVDIPIQTPHRIEALDESIEFIEVQTGTYFGEDDITRIEDDYGRT
jgi:mannose-6-phosphate isomerase